MKKFLNSIDEILASITLIIMLAVAFANVIGRQFANLPISFTDELTSKLFVLFSLLGASIAAKRGTHLGLTIVTDALPKKVSSIISAVGFLIGTVFCLVLMFYGLKMTIYEYNVGQVTLTMQWPEWIFGSFIPIGSLLCAVRFLQSAINKFRGKEEEA